MRSQEDFVIKHDYLIDTGDVSEHPMMEEMDNPGLDHPLVRTEMIAQ